MHETLIVVPDRLFMAAIVTMIAGLLVSSHCLKNIPSTKKRERERDSISRNDGNMVMSGRARW